MAGRVWFVWGSRGTSDDAITSVSPVAQRSCVQLCLVVCVQLSVDFKGRPCKRTVMKLLRVRFVG